MAIVLSSSSVVPVVDLSGKRSSLPKIISKACEECGMFKVVNHGVSKEVIEILEKESVEFFSWPVHEKRKTGSTSYGCNNIGSNGDKGELEYLMLHTKHHHLITSSLNGAANDYVEAMQDLVSEVLDMIEDDLCGFGRSQRIFSSLIRDIESDSVLRINYYLPTLQSASSNSQERVGFGEHTDPQILTILRSNDVGGLQICTHDGMWANVPPDPDAFFFIVGDALQVMTNMRFKSVKHRVVGTMPKRRMSMLYFGAPPLDTWISPLSQLVHDAKYKFKSFTWREYKKATNASKLSDSRLNLFKRHNA